MHGRATRKLPGAMADFCNTFARQCDTDAASPWLLRTPSAHSPAAAEFLEMKFQQPDFLAP